MPTTPDVVETLRTGEQLLLSGQLYTGRDAAHKRLYDALLHGQPLPVALKNECIYYTGPCPAPKGRPIGSCGPTTSGRMDAYTPRLLEEGLLLMIGKGARSPEVVDACFRLGGVYLIAAGGAGAVYANCVKKAEVVAYPELGAEAIYRLTVENMPVTVCLDLLGNDLYAFGRKQFADE